MVAPVADTKSVTVSPAADGFAHSYAERWANVSPFNVSIDAGEYRYNSNGSWSSWSSATRSVEGIFAGSFSIPSKTGQTVSTVVESEAVVIGEYASQDLLLQVRRTSSPSGSTTLTTTVTVSGVAETWDLRTATVQGENDYDPIQPNAGTTYVIESTDSLFDGAGISPPYNIMLKGGDRGPLTIQNLQGTAENKIVIFNEPDAANPVVFNTTQWRLFNILDSKHWVLDGRHKWANASSQDPAVITYGIQFNHPGGTPFVTVAFRVEGDSSDWEVFGLGCEGAWDGTPLSNNGIRIFIKVGEDTPAGYTPTYVRDNWRIAYCYCNETHGEGIYAGSNMNADGSSPPAISNYEIDHFVCRNIGKDAINPKYQVGGIGLIHDNDISGCGLYDATGTQQRQGIRLANVAGTVAIYNNIVNDCTEEALYIQVAEIPASRHPGEEGIVDVYNNVFSRSGVLRTSFEAISGYVIGKRQSLYAYRNSTSSNAALAGEACPNLTVTFKNNTIAHPAEDATTKPKVYDSVRCTTTIRDNIIAYTTAANLTIPSSISSGTVTIANNLSDTITNHAFTNAAGDDYSLTASSPAVDAGSDSLGAYTGYPDDDIVGTARPQGDFSDIGAYEYVS